MNKKTGAWLFLLFLAFTGGCGYTTKANYLPSHIRSVYVQTFQNKSDQPNLDPQLRTALISAVQNDGELLIATEDAADAILTGEIISYRRDAVRYLNNEDIQEYRLSINVNFKFTDAKDGKVIVSADNFPGDTTFYLSGPSAKSENTARTDAINDLSHRILNKIMTLW